MYYSEKYYSRLELNKVLDLLCNEISMDCVRNSAFNIKPEWSAKKVTESLNQTFAAYGLISVAANPPFGNSDNPTESLERAKLGAALNQKELLIIAAALKTIRQVKNWRQNTNTNTETVIDEYFEHLAPNKYFEDKIFACIKDENTLDDNASPLLASLRRKIANCSADIRTKLEKIVRGNAAKFLQDAIITQRDGRFVVPVKSEYKSEIPGIVHDMSASGATLFIEPMSVVEINNDIRVLMIKEQEEIDRILLELSSEAASNADSVINSFNLLCDLCLIFGKARLAFQMRASLPKINTSGKISLKNARHPLISPSKVVPINIDLGVKYNCLVITGPNTGGKTVALKTLGLITLMAMCGLMIPCDDQSEVCIFDNILVDIGDEQSIEQSLSTFSSHMVNVISIIKHATSNSLVLIDELGSGTDPIEGAALARAILEKLLNTGSKIAATTHYAELKSFALDTDGVENASCEFNIETLLPTYKLLIGIPGRSNAFAISEKLGLEADVLNNAKNYITAENSRFERIIATLENERQKAQTELEKSNIMLKNITEERRALAFEKAKIKAENEKIIKKAKDDAERIVDSARRKSNALLDELNEIKKNAEADADSAFSNAKKAVNSATKDMHKTIDSLQINDNKNYVLPRNPVEGDSVRLIEFSRDGEVCEVSLKNEKVLVASGNLKIWVPFSKIKLLNKSEIDSVKKKSKATVQLTQNRNISSDFDMRGMAVDEGLIELNKYLNYAKLQKISTVTIIHGKGTGKLRAAVHSYLKANKDVKSFRIGLFGEGEDGVTIAEIDY